MDLCDMTGQLTVRAIHEPSRLTAPGAVRPFLGILPPESVLFDAVDESQARLDQMLA